MLSSEPKRENAFKIVRIKQSEYLWPLGRWNRKFYASSLLMEASIKYSVILLESPLAVEPQAESVFALLQDVPAVRPDIWSISVKYGHFITR